MKKISVYDYKDTLKYVLLFLVTFMLLQIFVGVAYIPSGSMEPTLNVGKKYLFNQTSYLFKGPQRGDIIVFDDHGVVFCKRIIGLPGDSIDLVDGSVYINGELLNEEYANGATYAYTSDHYDVPAGEYFFMGDNRLNSSDSRLWPYPYITKRQILGRLIKFK